METAVLVPVKAFGVAKARLSGALSPADRRRLAQWTAERVLEAVATLPTFVACDDEGVAEWAEAAGAHVLWGPGLGLNGAIDHGVDTIAGKGADQVVVTHGDLPIPWALPDVARPERIVLVPDRRRDGTNVLARPCGLAMPAAYGPGSFRRHLAAALATGVAVSVRSDAHLSIDIDTVDDCCHPLVRPLLEGVVSL